MVEILFWFTNTKSMMLYECKIRLNKGNNIILCDILKLYIIKE